jgi:nitrogen fixation protein FixH
MLNNSESDMPRRGGPRGPEASKPLTGRSVVILLGLFFGVMFAANGALIYGALSTLHGEELENPYDASQVYNQSIAASRAQDALGWTVEVTTRQSSEGVHVVADFRDRQGAIIPDLQVRARFVHPFDRASDREAVLASAGGAYEGAAPLLHEGRWTLVIEASQGQTRKFASENKLTLGAAGG